jgi:hypothetical protein
MSEIVWGVTPTRKTKVEKFSTPVVTMAAIVKDGQGRKFSFNKAAQEALGLTAGDEGDSYVGFGFDADNIYLMASTTEEKPSMIKVNKSFSLSDKKTFEFIIKKKDLTITHENYLHLEQVGNEPFYKVSSITNDNEVSPEPQGTTDDTTGINSEENTNAETTEETEPENTNAEVSEKPVLEDNWN